MIQYRHRNCDKAFTPATFAYELPPANLFMEMIIHGEPIINFPLAVTYVHKKDAYCKATGRAVSEHILFYQGRRGFICNKVEPEAGRAYFNLASFEDNIICQVSVDFQRKKVRMEWIDFA